MKKTIKELADELGVSKDKVKYQARKLPSKLTTKISGVTYLNKEAIAIIKKNIVGSYTQVKNDVLPTDSLVKQLEKSSELLSEKDKQIEKLQDSQKMFQKLLDQQQILTLQANKKIEQLEIQLSTEEIPTDSPSKKSDADVASEKSKGFFSRLFTK
ncbi:DUF536 domain-containing protein [Carnobacterium maltaromaticum]|uniref:DUF536 domain-containing protein n=1 Tax=Carnobacterium maltaromaticum TaxID=2751 RepID=A0AAW9KAP1_CARML|nr:DUF536 domain-containing protein [Carnobacterium maltaromaticum]MDZ5760827.1 DUF536 domain-containing protein [Carnobacterium maltaromaticum]